MDTDIRMIRQPIRERGIDPVPRLMRGGIVAGAMCLSYCIVLTGLVSCVSTSGTKSTLTSSALSKINKAGVFVDSKNPLSVRIARDKMTNTGGILFGLVGAGIEAGYKASKDSAYEKEMIAFWQGFDVVKESAVAFQEKFIAAKVFPVVEIMGMPSDAQQVDALFSETIEEWGLRLCSGLENVQVTFDIHAKLVLLSSNETVWERDELFMHGPCRPLNDFRNNPELLGMELRRATQILAARLANDIAFP